MNVLIIAATGVQPLPEPLGRPQSVLELVSAKQPNDVPTRLTSGPDEAASSSFCTTFVLVLVGPTCGKTPSK